MTARLNLTGRKFSRLEVLSFSHIKNSGTFWNVRCDCGSVKKVRGTKLTAGTTRSCGCLAREVTKESRRTHGLTKSAEYKAWIHIRSRCLYKKDKKYYLYGGRGIKVCERWMKFENFYKDMGDKPSPDHSIDRIDSNGNYEPENCRWATAKEQSRNTRRNIYLDVEGELTLYVEACTKYNIERSAIAYLMKVHNISRQAAFNEIILKRGCW